MLEQVRKAKDVKQRYEKKWSLISEVVAIGVGTVNNEIAIIVSVEANAEKVKAKLPLYVEGIPVKVQLTGTLGTQ